MMDTWARGVTTLDTRLNSMNGWATRRLIYLPPPLRCVVLQLHYFALLCKTSLHFERARVLLSLSLSFFWVLLRSLHLYMLLGVRFDFGRQGLSTARLWSQKYCRHMKHCTQTLADSTNYIGPRFFLFNFIGMRWELTVVVKLGVCIQHLLRCRKVKVQVDRWVNTHIFR